MHEIKAQGQFDIDSNGEVSDEEAKVSQLYYVTWGISSGSSLWVPK